MKTKNSSQHDSKSIIFFKGFRLPDIREWYRNINYRQLAKNHVPIIEWLPKYNVSNLLHDILAGLTVALTEIPQGIAFALIAGLSPEYGLYCGFMGGFMYALFGTCKDVNIGPTSIMALMLQTHVATMGPDAAVIISFIAGIIIFILGLLNLAFVVEFFSYPIIAGFTCAASLQIASTQIKPVLGIPGKADKFLEAWISVFENLEKIKQWDSILGILSILFLVALREIRRYGSLSWRPELSKARNALSIFIFLLSLARNAIVVVVGTLLAYELRDHQPFTITGDVKGGFPPFAAPPFTITNNGTTYYFVDILKDYGPSIAFLPLVSILEAVSIAKAFSKGKTLDATQEMLSLGICNVMGSFVRSMPVTGSFTRTAVNNASGVKTTLAGVFTSLVVLLAIAFLTPAFHYVPKPTLASVIICAMFYLFDFDAFSLLWKSRKLDLVPFLTTFLCCIFISLEYGILIGIGVNLCFVLYASARPKFNPTASKIDSNDILTFTPKDTLFFPAAEYLKETVLTRCDNSQIVDLVIVIDGKYMKTMDITVAKSVSALVQEINFRNRKIVFVNFKKSIQQVCVGTDDRVANVFCDGDLELALRSTETPELPLSEEEAPVITVSS